MSRSLTELGRQLPSPPTHLHFRTTSIYPWVSAPKGIRGILHGPKVHRDRKEREKGTVAGRRGHRQGPSWLGMLVEGKPCPAPPHWAAGGLGGGRLTVDDREPTREGHAGRAACKKTFRRLAATLRGKPPRLRPRVVPLPGQPPKPPPRPHGSPRTPRTLRPLAHGLGPPGAGGGGGDGATASPRPRAPQPPGPGTRRWPGALPLPRRAGARRAAGASLLPLAAAHRRPNPAGPGRRAPAPAPAPPPLSLSPPPPPPRSLLPSLPPSPFQSTQCRNVPKMTSERSRIPCLSAAAAEGTGKKQQEGRAMATLDRKVPSPEAFLGKPWSSWIDAAKLHCSDSKNPTASSSFYYPVTFPFT